MSRYNHFLLDMLFNVYKEPYVAYELYNHIYKKFPQLNPITSIVHMDFDGKELRKIDSSDEKIEQRINKPGILWSIVRYAAKKFKNFDLYKRTQDHIVKVSTIVKIIPITRFGCQYYHTESRQYKNSYIGVAYYPVTDTLYLDFYQ